MSGMQAAVADCLRGVGAMCQAQLAQLKADAKLAVKQALSADGPFELSPQASYPVITLSVPLRTWTQLASFQIVVLGLGLFYVVAAKAVRR